MSSRTNSPGKKRIDAIFVKLHKLRIGPSMIGLLSGYSPTYVRERLDVNDCRERWSSIADVRSSLPSDLAEECASILNRNFEA